MPKYKDAMKEGWGRVGQGRAGQAKVEQGMATQDRIGWDKAR